MSRCQNPCERGEIIRCTVAFSECLTADHKPECFCKEGFTGNGTESCVPFGFNTEANKVGTAGSYNLPCSEGTSS